MRMLLRLGSLVALTLASGCSSLSSPPPSVITTGADGLRVFSWVAEWNGVLLDCGIPAAGGGVRGIIQGNQTSPADPVWLVGADDRALSVVWPAGFSASFSPSFSLHDDKGDAVAQAGDMVVLPDVDPHSASGTVDDPYVANGRVFDGCYWFIE